MNEAATKSAPAFSHARLVCTRMRKDEAHNITPVVKESLNLVRLISCWAESTNDLRPHSCWRGEPVQAYGESEITKNLNVI